MGSSLRIGGVIALLAGIFIFTPARPAQAAGVVGTGSAASCTEAALDAALAGGGLVSFNCGPGNHTIALTSEKIISTNTTVNGGGVITLDGQGQTRHFYVNQGVTLDLNGMTLTGGNGIGASDSGRGGAIFTPFGTVRVTESTITGNSASISGGGIRVLSGTAIVTRSTLSDNSALRGGAIRSSSGGTIRIFDSTVSGNTASESHGGGLHVSTSEVEITQSTISGNHAAGSGGGVYNNGSTVTITNSTLSENSAASGGAINRFLGSVNLQNTIIANSVGGNCAGSVISQDYNLSDDVSCNLIQTNDLPGTPAALTTLGDFGGPTLTHHPRLSSQALDTGTCLAPSDQRGVARPQNGTCDRGSVEARALTLLPSLCVNFYTGTVTSPYSGQCDAGQWQINQPSPYPLSFCVNLYTGLVSYALSGGCLWPRVLHVVPDNGALYVCWNRYTGALRQTPDPLQCHDQFETAAVVPAPI